MPGKRNSAGDCGHAEAARGNAAGCESGLHAWGQESSRTRCTARNAVRGSSGNDLCGNSKDGIRPERLRAPVWRWDQDHGSSDPGAAHCQSVAQVPLGTWPAPCAADSGAEKLFDERLVRLRKNHESAPVVWALTWASTEPADAFMSRAAVRGRAARSAEGETPSGQPAGCRRYTLVRLFLAASYYFFSFSLSLSLSFSLMPALRACS